jgi:hypothetical protein
MEFRALTAEFALAAPELDEGRGKVFWKFVRVFRVVHGQSASARRGNVRR